MVLLWLGLGLELVSVWIAVMRTA